MSLGDSRQNDAFREQGTRVCGSDCLSCAPRGNYWRLAPGVQLANQFFLSLSKKARLEAIRETISRYYSGLRNVKPSEARIAMFPRLAYLFL